MPSLAELAGLQNGLLGTIYGRADALKRTLADLAQNPLGILGQRTGQMEDTERGLLGLLSPQGSPEQQRWSDTTANMAPGLLGITAYHGSPHLFDKFDLSKIGTGEGAQAYGHGLYFADNPAVARQYANDLAAMRQSSATSKLQAAGGDVDGAIAAARAEIDRLRSLPNGGGDPARQARLIALQEEKLSEFAKLKSGQPMSQPSLYKVDIPDEAVANMLHWDKPLSEQPANVQNALDKLMAPNMRTRQVGPDLVDVFEQGNGSLGVFPAAKVPEVMASPSRYTPYQGDLLMRVLADRLGGQEAASNYLKQNGVPGIRYLDQGSRSGGQGTYNTVLFDDTLAKILGRE